LREEEEKRGGNHSCVAQIWERKFGQPIPIKSRKSWKRKRLRYRQGRKKKKKIKKTSIASKGEEGLRLKAENPVKRGVERKGGGIEIVEGTNYIQKKGEEKRERGESMLRTHKRGVCYLLRGREGRKRGRTSSEGTEELDGCVGMILLPSSGGRKKPLLSREKKGKRKRLYMVVVSGKVRSIPESGKKGREKGKSIRRGREKETL